MRKKGPTPLDVMIEAMQFFCAQAKEEQGREKPNLKAVRSDMSKAAGIAKDVAIYMHHRLTPVDGNGDSVRYQSKKRDRARRARETDSKWTQLGRALQSRNPGTQAA